VDDSGADVSLERPPRTRSTAIDIDSMRVLVLAQRLPYAPDRGDRIRVYHALRDVAARARVNVAALVHDEDEESHAADLAGIADEVMTARVPYFKTLARAGASLLGRTPLTHVLLDSPAFLPALTALVRRKRPDVVLSFCSSMARFALAPPLADIPRVIDMIDTDSAKWATLATESSIPRRWIYRREKNLLGRFESRVVRQSFATLVVNNRERAALQALAPDSVIQVVENGVDRQAFSPPGPPRESATVVFCGVMNYGPNEQAASWLARDIWPLVRAGRPDARLLIIGASPSPAVLALASERSGVIVTGRVADVRPYLWDAAVATAPLHIARGVQNKVLEAVASGLPCVVTPAVAEGLPPEVEPACTVGESPRQFADAIGALLRRAPSERRAVAARADLAALSWANRLRPLVPLLAAAARSRQATSGPAQD
jgi:sugar transferase (PEP-CTERM/EpsH1 system associated)